MNGVALLGADELRKIIQDETSRVLRAEFPDLLRKSQEKEFLSTNDLMDLTGWSRRKVQYLKSKGEIPALQKRGSRTILYRRSDIIEYLQNGKTKMGAGR